jgi:hypothetical protein
LFNRARTGAVLFWICCGSPAKFDEDCRKLAKLVPIPEFNDSDLNQDVKELVKNWLESEESGDWILVLDDVDNKLDFSQHQLEVQLPEWPDIF